MESAAFIEGSSLARGLKAIDSCIKKASVERYGVYFVSPGKCVLWITGPLGEVQESYAEGLREFDQTRLSSAIIQDIHPVLQPALDAFSDSRGIYSPMLKKFQSSVGLLEWSDVSVGFVGMDEVLKRMDVSLEYLRLAKGIGGRTLALFQGDLGELEAAVDHLRNSCGTFLEGQIIARPDPIWLTSVKSLLLEDQA